MEDPLIKFYKKIYILMLTGQKLNSENYLYPMEVAAFNLAVTDFESGILRKKEEIIYKINEKYNKSAIILNTGAVKSLQPLIHQYGSNVIAKKTYNKIDFLSLLTSFSLIKRQINFINSIQNIFYPRGRNIELDIIKGQLNIDLMKYSKCKII